jgi:hypothetical protein
MASKDPDDAVVAVFKNAAFKNTNKSATAGRPVFDDEEIVELRYPGSKNWCAYMATDFSHWGVDPATGVQIKVSYAERFRRQYQQFKSHSVQTKSGTPLQYAAFLTEARRSELRAQNIYTVEALAAIDGLELKNLGHGGREMKNAAVEYIQESQSGASSVQVQAELEALRAKNQVMEEDLAALKAKAAKPIPPKQAVSFEPADEFDGMDINQLREYITTHTGQPPIGAVNTKTLRRMARDLRVEKASAA